LELSLTRRTSLRLDLRLPLLEELEELSSLTSLDRGSRKSTSLSPADQILTPL
jgi:hypothetical protein